MANTPHLQQMRTGDMVSSFPKKFLFESDRLAILKNGLESGLDSFLYSSLKIKTRLDSRLGIARVDSDSLSALLSVHWSKTELINLLYTQII